MNTAKLKRMTRRTEFYMLIVLILLIGLVQVRSGGKLIALPGVFTRLNVTVLRTMVVDGMFAMCSLVVMISGGFDLSFPAIAALSYSLASTICLNNGWCQTNPIAGFVLAIVIGCFVINAYHFTKAYQLRKSQTESARTPEESIREALDNAHTMIPIQDSEEDGTDTED